MKKTIAGVAAAGALGGAAYYKTRGINPLEYEQDFTQYIAEYGKSYGTTEEY